MLLCTKGCCQECEKIAHKNADSDHFYQFSSCFLEILALLFSLLSLYFLVDIRTKKNVFVKRRERMLYLVKKKIGSDPEKISSQSFISDILKHKFKPQFFHLQSGDDSILLTNCSFNSARIHPFLSLADGRIILNSKLPCLSSSKNTYYSLFKTK